jgi:hypothetical protein
VGLRAQSPSPILKEVVMAELQGKRAAVLVEQMYQEMEVW